MIFKPLAEMTVDERKDMSAAIQQQIQRSQTAANQPEIQYNNKIAIGAMYGSNRQNIDKWDYSPYRDKSCWRSIQSKKALLTASAPRPVFFPDGPLDVPLADVFKHVLDDILDDDDVAYTSKYIDMVDDELTYSTGFFEFHFDMPTFYKCDIEVVPLSCIGVADWTQTVMARQPYWYRAGMMTFDEANELNEDEEVVPSNLAPSNDFSLMPGVRLQFSNWWQASGGDSVKNPLVKKDDAEKAFMSGNVFYHKYQVKDGDGVVWQAHLINGRIVRFEMLKSRRGKPLKHYTLCPYRNKRRNMSFLGISEVELSKDLSDLKSEYLQAAMAQAKAYGKKWIEVNELAGISEAKAREWLQNPMTVTVTSAETFANNSSIRIHEFNQGLDRSLVEMLGMLSSILETDTGNTQWVEGTVSPGGPDPAAKTQMLMGAGMAQIRQQAIINNNDGLKDLARLLLWHIQENLTDEFIVQITGKYLPDGSPRFIDVNLEIDKLEMGLLMDAVDHAKQTGFKGMLKFGNGVFRPDEILTQIEAIHERVDKHGLVDVNKLNDLSIARFKIRTGDSQEFDYNKSRQEAMAFALYDRGVADIMEIREVAKMSTNPASMEKLPAVKQAKAQEQMAEAQMMAAQQGQGMPPQGRTGAVPPSPEQIEQQLSSGTIPRAPMGGQ